MGGRAEFVGVEAVDSMERSAATLRFFGETLDPDEITRLLGRHPSAAERKGDIVGPRKNRTARQGSWRLSVVDREPGDLDAQIDEILRDITTDLSVWRQLTQVYAVDLFCGVWLDSSSEEHHISPTTLLKLGERGIRLSLDVYANIEPNEEPDSA